MEYYESVCQGNSGPSPVVEFFESVCQGDSAISPSDKFFQSVLSVGSATYLKRFQVDDTAQTFEIIK